MTTLSWSSPYQLSGVTGTTGPTGASDPRVVVDPNGNATAVWVQNNMIMASTALFSGSIPPSPSWSGATGISNPSNSASSPKLGVDSYGNVTALWIENNGSSNSIYYSILPGPTGTWQAENGITGSTGASVTTLAVDSYGNALTAWIGSGGLVYLSVRPTGLANGTALASSGSWGSAAFPFSGATGYANPTVAIGGAGVTGKAQLITACYGNSNGDEILASVNTISSIFGTPSVGSWSTQKNLVALTGVGNNHNYPKVAVDTSGNGAITWFRYNTSDNPNLEYINVITLAATLTYSSTNTSTWSLPVQLSEIFGKRNPADLNNHIKFDNNENAMVLWTTSSDGSSFNLDFEVKQNTDTLSGDVQFLVGNIIASQADVAITSTSDAVFVYRYFDGTNAAIWSTETDIGGNVIGAYPQPVAISTGMYNSTPRTSVSYVPGTTGYTYAPTVWITSDGTSNNINASIGSRLLLGAPSGLTGTQSVNNFQLFQDYYNTISWTASTDPNTQGYNIYRDSVLVGQVYPPTTQFVDHNRVQNGVVQYGVSAFDINYFQSKIINLTMF